MRVDSRTPVLVLGFGHGGLAIARVGYGTWWKFSWPILLILGVLSMVGLAVASAL